MWVVIVVGMVVIYLGIGFATGVLWALASDDGWPGDEPAVLAIVLFAWPIVWLGGLMYLIGLGMRRVIKGMGL